MASLSLYILTFNCGRTLVDVDALSSQLFDALSPDGVLPDLLFLSLQEIAPIYASFIGGSFLVPYFAKVEDAVNKATAKISGGEAYELITARNVGMTALLAFSRDQSAIEHVETAGVGVGIMEMGNKGAVGVHLSYKKSNTTTEITFVAAHLAAMESEVDRRNQDWKNIARGLVFDSADERRRNAGDNEDEQSLLSGTAAIHGIYKPESYLFVAGDLNYRTSVRKPGPEHYRTFPQPKDSSGSARHYLKLFELDQLNQERLAGRTCQGLLEAKVNFPPTYKYASEEPYLVADEELDQWSWAKHRWPSWCDRILYLDMPAWAKYQSPEAKIVSHKYIALPLMPTSDHRAVASLLEIPVLSSASENNPDDSVDPRISPPVPIDRHWKLRREKARQLELLVGFGAYFTTTLEGSAIALATFMGILGGFFALKMLLEF